MITPNTRLKELAKHPIGYDLYDQLGTFLKIDFSKLAFLGKLRLKDLTTISAGIIDKSAVDKVCEVMNYEEKDTIANDCEVEQKWWKEAVFYQIYPRSFCDSNGDGVGDIQGIISKLDYLKDLGIDCIWCCPMYDSPNDDNGYDIRDYKKIMAEFGTMDDFDQLLDEVHKRGMRLIMDLVVNHTSDEHEWFVNAKSSVDNPYHNYYLWRDGKGKDMPPNNWKCMFSGSAWNYYESVDKWALHVFSKKQMDLNWDNPDVRRDVYEMMNFWFEKGIDGFRMDVINFISKTPDFPEGVPFFELITGYVGAENYFYGPKLHEYLREMRRESFGNYDCVTVGEMAAVGLEMAKMVTADKRKELDMIFTFDHVDNSGHSKYDDYAYSMYDAAETLMKYQTDFTNHCWPTVFFENHDIPRITSKVDASNTYRHEIAKLVATVQLTFRGTPFIYQGQEIAMTNGDFESIDEIRDVEGVNLYKELVEKKKKSPEKAFAKVMAGSRDHTRTPVQWDDSENAGFTTGTPWIKVNKDYLRNNVKNQLEIPDSTLNYFKKLIKLRHDNKGLVYGDLIRIPNKSKQIMCYYREYKDEKYFVELNMTGKTCKRWHDVSEYTPIALSNNKITVDYLKPYEANVYRVK